MRRYDSANVALFLGPKLFPLNEIEPGRHTGMVPLLAPLAYRRERKHLFEKAKMLTS